MHSEQVLISTISMESVFGEKVTIQNSSAGNLFGEMNANEECMELIISCLKENWPKSWDGKSLKSVSFKLDISVRIPKF